MNKEDCKKKLILFGAGKNGRLALKKYGYENITYFCDNNKMLQGTIIEGIEVIGFEKMVELYHQDYHIMITPANYAFLAGQLEQAGIVDYLIFKAEEIPVDRMQYITGIIEEYAEHNQKLDELIQIYSDTDLLEDISLLKVASKEALNRNKMENLQLAYRGFNEEGGFYGNYKVLMDYAELSPEDIKYFPEVSHNFGLPLYTIGFCYKSAVIFSGTYYRRKIHEHFPYVPVFTVGPYIYYAKGIYSKKIFSERKQKMGKTLLVFLPHTIEKISRKYDRKQFVDQVLQRYERQYKTIWMCVYWADINDDVCDYAEGKGIHIVSAGLRFDSNFDNRLRTIMELSDDVVCGDFGTFIFYSVWLKKRISRLDISDNGTITDGELKSELERTIQITEDNRKFYKSFFGFFDDKMRLDEAQIQWTNECVGLDQIRSREYIREIGQISKDIWCKCEGDERFYPEAVRAVYKQYDKQLDISKMQILKTATETYVD